MNASTPERRPATEQVSGVIERVTFPNDDSGFCVRYHPEWAAQKTKNRATLLRLLGVHNPMSSFLRPTFVTVILLLAITLASGDDTKPPAINPELAAADQLYRAGKFADAETSYQAVLKTDMKLVPAQV